MTFYDFDYILQTYVGEDGKWQWYQLGIILVLTVPMSVTVHLPVFTAYTPDHRCFIPECDSSNTAVAESWLAIAVPKTRHKFEFLRDIPAFSNCERFNHFNNTESNQLCSVNNFDYTETITCETYVYDQSVFKESLTTKLDLVCDNEYKVKLLGTSLMLGLLVGNVFAGVLIDKFGRQRVLLWSNIGIVPVIIAGGFIPNYEVYVTVRFVTMSITCVMWVASIILAMEIFGKSMRNFSYFILIVMLNMSKFVLPIVAYLQRDWKFIHFWIGLLAALPIPCVAFFLEESTRWKILNGKEIEAVVNLEKMAYWNKKVISAEDGLRMKHSVEILSKQSKESSEKNLFFIHLFTPKFLATTLVCMMLWMTSWITYYALMLNVAHIYGDIFLNFVLYNMVDIPSPLIIFFSLDRIGRKLSAILSQVILGLCCISLAFIPKACTGGILALCLLAKVFACTSGSDRPNLVFAEPN